MAHSALTKLSSLRVRGTKPRHLEVPPDYLQLADQSQREQNPPALIKSRTSGSACLWWSCRKYNWSVILGVQGCPFSDVDHRKNAYATHVWNVGIATLCRNVEDATQTRPRGPRTIPSKQGSCNTEMLTLNADSCGSSAPRYFMFVTDQHRFQVTASSGREPTSMQVSEVAS